MENTTNPAVVEANPQLVRGPYFAGGPRVWAAAVLMLAGLGLIALGGLFLVGVLMLVTYNFNSINRPPTPSPEESFLLVLLYVLAFACFAAALFLLVTGVWWLFRILRDPTLR